ncbi:MAG: hypothetical protein LBW85_05350 [Deltaproteobacteria bacterium]|jgi:hypothetical protein|nr:hypothetical protein [Deltaproteobacteria bacterium]
MTDLTAAKAGARKGRLQGFPGRAALLAVLASLALAGASCGEKKQGEEAAWQSLQILLNAAFGEGAWSAGSRAYDPQSGSLTVFGVEADLAKADAQVPAEYRSLLTGKATARSVSVSGLLPPDEMREVAEAASWAGRPEKTIARSFSLRGLHAPFGDGKASLELNLAELDATDVRLLAGPPPAAPGQEDLSLPASLEFGTLTKKGLSVKARFPADAVVRSAASSGEPTPEAAAEQSIQEFLDSADEASGGSVPEDGGPAMAESEFTLEAYEAVRLGFTPLAEPPAPGAPDAFRLLFGLRADRLGWSGASLKASVGGKSPVTLAASAREAEVLGLSRVGEARSVTIKGAEAEFRLAGSDDPDDGFKAAVESFEGEGLDLTPLFPVYLPALTQAAADGTAGYALLQAKTCAEFFVYPISFKSLAASGVSLDARGASLTEGAFSLTGPVTAWTLGDVSEEFSGTLSLSDDRRAGSADVAAELQDLFGRASFAISYAAAVKASPSEGGLYSIEVSRLAADGVLDLTGSLSLTGVTSQVIDALKGASIYSVTDNFSVAAALVPVGIRSFRVTFKDQALTEALVRKSAAALEVSPESLKEAAADAVAPKLAEWFGAPPEAFSPLAGAVRSFLESPSSFELAMSPPEPATVTAAAPFIAVEDYLGLLNFLNFTVKVGSEPAVPAADVFDPALSAAPQDPVTETDLPEAGSGSDSGDDAGPGSDSGDDAGSDSGSGAGSGSDSGDGAGSGSDSGDDAGSDSGSGADSAAP